jgi:chromosome segregation ATPase
MFNPLDYPTIFLDTEYLAVSAWCQHTPFARFIMALTRPSVFVELGAHYGVSYFAFCQAVRALNLPTRCYAVDTWQGDPQAGFYGEEVFEQVQQYNTQRYNAFSCLLRMTFDEALQRFAEGEIDLLHIDGYHTYEAVRHDYESWLPKMSQHGIVLLHDINVREGSFGVWQLWLELRAQFPYFELLHEHGLGVLAVGEAAATSLAPLLSLSEDDRQKVSEFFSQIGQRITLQAQLENAHHRLAECVSHSRREREMHAQELERARDYIRSLEQNMALCDQHRQAEQAAYAEEIERARSYIRRLEIDLALQVQQRQAEQAAHAEEIERARGYIQTLEAERTAHAEAIEQARGYIQRLEIDLALQVQQRQAEQAAHAEEIERARAYIQTLEAERTAHAEAIEQARSYIQRLELDLALQVQQRQAEQAAHAEEIERARAYIQHIEQESSARAVNLQQAEAQLTALQQTLDERQQAINALQETVQSLSQQLSDWQAQAAHYQHELVDLREKLAESEASRAALEASLGEAHKTLERLQRKLHAYRVLD